MKMTGLCITKCNKFIHVGQNPYNTRWWKTFWISGSRFGEGNWKHTFLQAKLNDSGREERLLMLTEEIIVIVSHNKALITITGLPQVGKTLDANKKHNLQHEDLFHCILYMFFSPHQVPVVGFHINRLLVMSKLKISCWNHWPIFMNLKTSKKYFQLYNTSKEYSFVLRRDHFRLNIFWNSISLFDWIKWTCHHLSLV